MRRAALIAGLLALASASCARPAPDRREVYSELLRADSLAFRLAEKEASVYDHPPADEDAFLERLRLHFSALGLERSKLRTAIARRHHVKHDDLRAIDAEGDREGW